MQCLILAGGRGTRLAEQSGGRPKHLVDVAGRPFADVQLDYLARSGVDEVVYCIGYRGDQIRAHVGDGHEFGLNVVYVDEGNELRGTAGAIRLALDTVDLAPRFLVLYGDSLPDIDLRDVMRTAEDTDAPALMTVLHNHNEMDRSNATFDGRLVYYDKFSPTADMDWIDYGVSVLTRDIVTTIPSGQVMDLAHLFHDLSVRSKLVGYPAKLRFYEIGTPESRDEFARIMEKQKDTN